VGAARTKRSVRGNHILLPRLELGEEFLWMLMDKDRELTPMFVRRARRNHREKFGWNAVEHKPKVAVSLSDFARRVPLPPASSKRHRALASITPRIDTIGRLLICHASAEGTGMKFGSRCMRKRSLPACRPSSGRVDILRFGRDAACSLVSKKVRLRFPASR
jgi:hypothetical protein